MVNLPQRIGGTWTLTSFQQWQKERIDLEILKSNDIIENHDVGNFGNDQLVASKDCLIRETISKTNEHRFIRNVTYQKTTKKTNLFGFQVSKTPLWPASNQTETPQSISNSVPLVEDIPDKNVEHLDDFSVGTSIFEGDFDDMSLSHLDPNLE